VFLIPVLLSIGAWLVSFYFIYGTVNPEAPYGDYARLYVINENIPRGLLGLLFDQKFGLLVYAPIYVLAAAGGWYLLRAAQGRYFAALLILLTAAFVGSTTRLYMWWGGSSAPARFLVPVLPCLAPLIAVAVSRVRSPVSNGLLAAGLSIGIGVALVGSLWPLEFYLFSDPHGRGRVFETMQAGAPLAFTLPTFTNEDWVTPLRALGPWLAAAALAVGGVWAAATRWQWSAFSAATAAGLAFAFSAAVMTARPAAAIREATARRGGVELLWAYNAPRHDPFSLTTFRRLPVAEFYAAAEATMAEVPTGPIALPEGRYEARIWFSGNRPRQGEILVASSPTLVHARMEGALSNPTVLPFRLPVESGRVTVDVRDEAVAAGIASVDIRPVEVVPADRRLNARVRAVESIPSRPDAYLVYTDEHAYPEGGVFWTRGTAATTVMVSPAGASRLHLVLHLGPLSGRVAVSVAGQDYSTHVPANDVAVLEVPLPPGEDLVPVTIASPGFFRPAEVDPRSNDTRGLGCQVRVELG
jgi:hypothetical protein